MRGELWTVAGGVYASTPRPALIIQDDAFTDTDSVTVLPLTTTTVNASLLRVPITPTPDNGLAQDSWVMIDKLTTVRRANLGQHLGQVSTDELVTIERLLTVFLGLARKTLDRNRPEKGKV